MTTNIPKTTTTKLPTITNRQLDILIFLAKFQFLNRIQIQNLLQHKDKKTINLWLRDLTAKQLINRIYSSSYGENTKPAIYYLSDLGLLKLKDSGNLSSNETRKIKRYKERTSYFIDNCIFIADIYLNLEKITSTNKNYTAYTTYDIVKSDSIYYSLASFNLDLVIKKTERKKIQYFLLLTIPTTTPLYAVKRKLKELLEYFFQSIWEENIKTDFPILLLCCSKLTRLIQVKRMTKRLLDENQNPEGFICRMTTVSEINEKGFTSDIWEEV